MNTPHYLHLSYEYFTREADGQLGPAATYECYVGPFPNQQNAELFEAEYMGDCDCGVVVKRSAGLETYPREAMEAYVDGERYLSDNLNEWLPKWEAPDPTLYCTACGARTQPQCHCGPIAANE